MHKESQLRNNTRMITRILIYGALGCLMEILWTGISALLKKEFKLIASTSLWMFPIYGLAVFLEPVCTFVAPLPFPIRGLIYSCLIFAMEFTTGSLLKIADICPWDYSDAKYHVKGLIRLDYLPAWGAAGLIFERIYRMLTAV